MVPAGMPKWTEQEQRVLWIVLVIFFAGIAGKAWLKTRSPEPLEPHAATVVRP